MNATNKVVSKVSVVKKGTSEYGEWILYNIIFEGSDKKFVYLGGGKRPVPFDGMKVPYLEYDIEKKEKDGKEYTNYNIKELKINEEQKAPAASPAQTTADNKPYINHGQVIIDLMKIGIDQQKDLFSLVREFNTGLDILLKGEKMKVSDAAKNAKTTPDNFDSPFDPDSIPDSEIPF